MARKPVPQRADYRSFHRVTTRWMDNDVYGHVNNAHYFSFFDSAVNAFLIAEGGLDVQRGPVVGFVVSSGCDFHAPVAYPEPVEVGIRVEEVGRSSARYGVALFADGDDRARAAGHMVHVFVSRETGKSTPIPDPIRAALLGLRGSPAGQPAR
jgi:acyl-CoA thioester hydrolase